MIGCVHSKHVAYNQCLRNGSSVCDFTIGLKSPTYNCFQFNDAYDYIFYPAIAWWQRLYFTCVCAGLWQIVPVKHPTNIQWMNEWVNEWSFYELYCMLENDKTLKLDPRQWEILSTRAVIGAQWVPMSQFGLASSELWCWRRLLSIPWTARRSNQSLLKEISPGCSLEGLMLKMKLQYLGHLMKELTHWKRSWCWEALGAGGKGDDRGWDGWIASPTHWTGAWVDSGSWWWTGRSGILQFMGLQRVGHDWATELNWR